MELEALLLTSVWILFNTAGLAYGIKVSWNTRSDFEDVHSGLVPVTEGQLYQARQNRKLARALLTTIASFWLVGFIALGFALTSSTPNRSLARVVQWGLIVGDVFLAYALYVLDNGRTRLRAIVGGRRASDKGEAVDDGDSNQMGMPNP